MPWIKSKEKTTINWCSVEICESLFRFNLIVIWYFRKLTSFFYKKKKCWKVYKLAFLASQCEFLRLLSVILELFSFKPALTKLTTAVKIPSCWMKNNQKKIRCLQILGCLVEILHFQMLEKVSMRNAEKSTIMKSKGGLNVYNSFTNSLTD